MKRIAQSADESGRQPGQPLRLVQDDEPLAVVDEAPPLLGITEAICQCMKVNLIFYAPFQAEKLVFHFKVLEPCEHEGLKLQMFVPLKKGRRLSVTSKLYQVAKVASPDLKQRTPITKAMFLKKIFRCSLGPTATASPYTIVKTLVERIAG